jgi:hypothetical protein
VCYGTDPNVNNLYDDHVLRPYIPHLPLGGGGG